MLALLYSFFSPVRVSSCLQPASYAPASTEHDVCALSVFPPIPRLATPPPPSLSLSFLLPAPHVCACVRVGAGDVVVVSLARFSFLLLWCMCVCAPACTFVCVFFCVCTCESGVSVLWELWAARAHPLILSPSPLSSLHGRRVGHAASCFPLSSAVCVGVRVSHVAPHSPALCLRLPHAPPLSIFCASRPPPPRSLHPAPASYALRACTEPLLPPSLSYSSPAPFTLSSCCLVSLVMHLLRQSRRGEEDRGDSISTCRLTRCLTLDMSSASASVLTGVPHKQQNTQTQTKWKRA